MCWKGKVDCGLSVQVLQTAHPTGPATVVRTIDNPEMALAAARMVRRLNLSGFVGFDFVIEASSGKAYLLEMNLRPTPICHLAVDRFTDMVGALARILSDLRTGRRSRASIVTRDIALFPQEMWRDASSNHLRNAYHDIPGDIPQFVSAYREPVASEPLTWVDCARSNYRAAIGRLGRTCRGAGAFFMPKTPQPASFSIKEHPQ